MEKESELKQLETYVERLLESFAQLKAENERLSRELLGQQENNAQLKMKVESLESEKGGVSSRVGSLIGRIESWESEIVVAVAGSEGEVITTDNESDNLVEAEAGEIEGNEEDERGGGVQTSLFSAESSDVAGNR